MFMEKSKKEALEILLLPVRIHCDTARHFTPNSVVHHDIQPNAVSCQVETDAIRCVYIIRTRDYPRCY